VAVVQLAVTLQDCFASLLLALGSTFSVQATYQQACCIQGHPVMPAVASQVAVYCFGSVCAALPSFSH
jgi:hypothetical protein